jgi:hypothetical protein
MYSVALLRATSDKTVHWYRKILMNNFNRKPNLAPKHNNLHPMKRWHALLHKCPKVSPFFPRRVLQNHISCWKKALTVTTTENAPSKWYRQPTRCNSNGLLVSPINSTCFGRWFRPSSRDLDYVYSLWYNAPTMLPAGNLEAEEILRSSSVVPPLPVYRPTTLWVHYTTSCKRSLVLLKMGEIIDRNMLSWLELLINRYCCI